jgi:hypothetical protein
MAAPRPTVCLAALQGVCLAAVIASSLSSQLHVSTTAGRGVGMALPVRQTLVWRVIHRSHQVPMGHLWQDVHELGSSWALCRLHYGRFWPLHPLAEQQRGRLQ